MSLDLPEAAMTTDTKMTADTETTAETKAGEPATAPLPEPAAPPVLRARDVDVFYGDKQAIKSVSLDIPRNRITALIGPSGCGKSTLLRCFNRMNDTIASARVDGEITFAGHDIYEPDVDVTALRRRIGMVFQKANPFPKSIFENVAYGLRIHGLTSSKAEMRERVIRALQSAGLYDEVADRLDESGTSLSGGQQQRLCIARAIAVEPQVILMDEPCSALDPIATARVEELMETIREDYTIVIVTHSMQQAARVADKTAFFHLGELVEEGPTEKIFTNPDNDRTQAYISGRIG